jgi:hypothetical protein
LRGQFFFGFGDDAELNGFNGAIEKLAPACNGFSIGV